MEEVKQPNKSIMDQSFEFGKPNSKLLGNLRRQVWGDPPPTVCVIYLLLLPQPEPSPGLMNLPLAPSEEVSTPQKFPGCSI